MVRILYALILASGACAAIDPASPNDAGEADAGSDRDAGSASDGPARTSALRVGSFNVRRLGLDPGTDVARVADIVAQHFDVISILEVMQGDHAGHPGLDALALALKEDFELLVTSTPRPDTGSPYAEHYALLYRDGRVRPCPGRDTLDHTPDGDDYFLREPAFTCLEALDAHGRPVNDFLLALYHARWSDGHAYLIRAEALHLDAAIAAMRERDPSERDLLLLGDFNLTPEALEPLTRTVSRTRGAGSTLTRAFAQSDRLYDQLRVFDVEASRELAGDAWVLDVLGFGGDAESYGRRVSDHLPIIALWRTDLPDDD